jgi:hypothetical protein
MRAIRLPLVFAAIAGLPVALAAQDNPRPGAIVGAEFHTLTFAAGGVTKSVSEFAVPLGFTMPVGRRITLDAGTYFVSAQREDSLGSKATVSGLTDVVLRTAIQLKPDVAVLTVALNLPTGQGSLTAAQDSVARVVATDLIPFQVANFGTGFNLTTGLAFATPVGPWALGLAGSYRYSGAYEPFAGNTASLKPGGEVRVRFGADRLVGQGRLSFGLTYSTFSNDEFGSNARSPGTRFIPQLSLSLPMGNNSLSLYAWDIYRKVTEDPADPTLANENTVTAGAMLALKTGRNSLRPQVEFRHSMRGPGGLQSNGSLIGLGLRYLMNAGTRVTITPSVRFDTGSRPDAGTASLGFTGFSGGLTIRTSL